MNQTAGQSDANPRVVEAAFAVSAPNLRLCPPPGLPELAIAGRSNVGKSSLINMLCNRKQLAKTSGTPGKTQLLNYFKLRIEPGSRWIHLVDLPGYGFTKTGKVLRDSWGKIIAEYLEKREGLRGLIHLVDARHEPSRQDIQMREWVISRTIPCVLVITKADKLSKTRLEEAAESIAKTLRLREDEDCLTTSAAKKQGAAELCAAILRLIPGPDGGNPA